MFQDIIEMSLSVSKNIVFLAENWMDEKIPGIPVRFLRGVII